MMINSIFITVQLFFTIVIGIYFLGQLRTQHSDKEGINEDSRHVMERLNAMRRISLTEPLTEQTRPTKLEEIIGQEQGVEALKVALGGKNPQHIIIYGPPGVGKTAASRVAMEFAKNTEGTPFRKDAKFIEVDATIMQYDERSIADPLIGSVHDPIYQGAGSYGPAGVPQPKEGAVSKAHGGVLFIDEIGELHPTQMNRLLKVLEDRKVRFESSYYSSTNKNIPRHIHDVFKNGIPADFRLIGATTRSPEEIPPALRSRCTEIFFDRLNRENIKSIIDNAVTKCNISIDTDAVNVVCGYCENGRDAVSMISTLSSKLSLEKRINATVEDVEWVIETGRYNPVYSCSVGGESAIGRVNGLAVTNSRCGLLIPIEAIFEKADERESKIICGGITEKETIKNGNQSLSRTSTARASVDNAITVLKRRYGVNPTAYNIHINIPGGMPVDGPSAGIAIFTACYSAVFDFSVSSKIAMTGELSISGDVMGVGGVREKIDAAILSGAEVVIIPNSNWCEKYKNMKIKVIPVRKIDEVVDIVIKYSDNSMNININSQELVSAKKAQ
ncbi:MAG: ATP-dependent protease LonB [Clostridia bacterium]|nr:ATP-dependent protease LonB [Clostridia bacterium]